MVKLALAGNRCLARTIAFHRGTGYTVDTLADCAANWARRRPIWPAVVPIPFLTGAGAIGTGCSIGAHRSRMPGYPLDPGRTGCHIRSRANMRPNQAPPLAFHLHRGCIVVVPSAALDFHPPHREFCA